MRRHIFKWFREHALWDAAKEFAAWIWAACGSAVTLAAQAILGYFRAHQDFGALLLTASVFVVFVIMALVLYRRHHDTPPLSPLLLAGNQRAATDVTPDTTCQECKGELDRVKGDLQTAGQQFEALKKKLDARRYYGIVFQVQSVKPDPPSGDPNITCKDKVRIVLTNVTGKDIHIWTPMWEPFAAMSQGSILPSKLALEGPKGWKAGDWMRDEKGKIIEHSCLELKANSTVSCWIGLVPPIEGSLERMKQIMRPLGTAIFLVKIEGRLYEVPVEVV